MKASAKQMEVLERAFLMPTLIGYWGDIHQRYRAMGFTDQLSDKDRIEEYDFISQQMNKYMSSHKDQILKSTDLEKMLAEVEKIHGKAPTSTKERKSLVYMAMRDEWLTGLFYILSNMIDEMRGDQEKEDDDDWTV